VRVDTPSGKAFQFNATQSLVLDDVTTFTPQKNAPVVSLKKSDFVWLRNSQAQEGTGVFVSVAESAPKHLVISGNEFSSAETPVVYGK
jgi:hypothetical protein